jgi:hypothetical protein
MLSVRTMKLLTSCFDSLLRADQRSSVVAFSARNLSTMLFYQTSLQLTICMGFEITSDTTKEGFLAKVAAEHSNHRASLEIADMIKDLVNL